MIRFLSATGRVFAIVGAFVAIFVSSYEGYAYQSDMIGLGIGFFGGCIVAGFIFGIIATLYEIRDNLRVLVERAEPVRAQEIPYVTTPNASAPESRPDDLRAT